MVGVAISFIRTSDLVYVYVESIFASTRLHCREGDEWRSSIFNQCAVYRISIFDISIHRTHIPVLLSPYSMQ